MSIDQATVKHYAKLAHLNFDEAELDELVTQLGSILNHIEKISELDLGHVEPTFQVAPTTPVFRPDKQTASLGSEAALANAPDCESDHFLVPKVIRVKGH